jgi:hypothetical protein
VLQADQLRPWEGAWQDPGKGLSAASGVFCGAAAMMQLRLLETYLALPSCAPYVSQHEALVKLCSRSLLPNGNSFSGEAAHLIQKGPRNRFLFNQANREMANPCMDPKLGHL